jgi:GPH family glycoside/pentoside/hexuronide:cation symporter
VRLPADRFSSPARARRAVPRTRGRTGAKVHRMNPKPYTAPNREIYSWAIGGIASHGLICTFGLASTIFTIGFKLDPVVVGWAMMLPRVFDALLDPWLGHLSDDTRTRWGRRKPFLVGASIAGAALLFLLYMANPAWSGRAQLLYLLVVGTLFYVCYGLYTMAWMALGYELTDDYHERSRVMAISSLFATIVFLAQNWMYRFALQPAFGGEIYGIRWVAGVVAVAVIATALVATLNCRERFTSANRTHVPIGQAVRATLRNKPFVVLLVLKLFRVFGDRVFTGLLVYVGIYYVCHGDKLKATGITGWGGTIGTLLSLALVPLIKPISKALGKRKGIAAAAASTVVLAAVLPFILKPGAPWLLLVPTLLLLPLGMLSDTLLNAVVPDICDLDELESGQRREGLFTAVMGFVQKLEISLTVLIVSYLVSFSGFDPAAATQPQVVLGRMFWLAVIPYGVFSVLTLVMALKFPMSEESMAQVRRQLDERRARAAQVGDAAADADADEGVPDERTVAVA